MLLPLFQFHKGAIRTYLSACLLHCVKLRHFNSIKVRLELRFLDPIRRPASHFNSIKVRLELLDHVALADADEYFNSIKVRLELMISD